MVDLSRRQFFRGTSGRSEPPQRMPWQVDEAAFTDHCRRCEACIQACPEQIVVHGDGGFPMIDFQHGECSFCQACVDICPAPVFRPRSEPPWQQTPQVSERCLDQQGVVCRSCQDSCAPAAIQFSLRHPGGGPVIDTTLCSGCGGCVSVCPVAAISIQTEDQERS